MPETETIKHYWLYALKLEQGKYYIGITSRKDPQERIQEHFNGFYSAQWVKKYKPLETHEVLDLGNITNAEARHLETKRTLMYMKKYGLQNARGGQLNYSGSYVKIGPWFGPRDNFFMILGVLVMLICVVGLFLMAR